MPPQEDDPLLDQWRQSALSDLLLAEAEPPPGVMFEQLCFHAQQSAEKSLKAMLVKLGLKPPRVHDIGDLLDLLSCTMEIPADLADADALTVYAVVTRYPPFARPLTREDWESATRTARRVLEWVERQFAES